MAVHWPACFKGGREITSACDAGRQCRLVDEQERIDQLSSPPLGDRRHGALLGLRKPHLPAGARQEVGGADLMIENEVRGDVALRREIAPQRLWKGWDRRHRRGDLRIEVPGDGWRLVAKMSRGS